MTCNFEQGDKAIIVWEVLTGQMLRAFPMATTTAVAGTGVGCAVRCCCRASYIVNNRLLAVNVQPFDTALWIVAPFPTCSCLHYITVVMCAVLHKHGWTRVDALN